jgi:hypothetical protein
VTILVDELVQQIFEGHNRSLSAPFKEWLDDSRRFRDFAEAYATKIRKKARLATDTDKLLDLRCELETAYRLLQDKKFDVAYEKQSASGGRAPDFSVMYRTHTPFNVEVTRPRIDDQIAAKLMETLCDKVGQMQPGVVNVLVIYAPNASGDHMVAAATDLRALAERKVEDYFTKRGFRDARTFIRQFQNLSAVILKTTAAFIWANSLAKKPLPDDLRKALQRVF